MKLFFPFLSEKNIQPQRNTGKASCPSDSVLHREVTPQQRAADLPVPGGLTPPSQSSAGMGQVSAMQQ